ncbi:MAG: hypothetical protein II916_03325 [Oscillospiraceae bacterium]|nr:hypothetical protein [Oscillospiraceae bacterium]
MTREEILAKSRNENKGADLAELQLESKARRISGVVFYAVCMALFIVTDVFDRNADTAFVGLVLVGYVLALMTMRGILHIRGGNRRYGITQIVIGAVEFAVLFPLLMVRFVKELGSL